MYWNFLLCGILLGSVHYSSQNLCMSSQASEEAHGPEGMFVSCQEKIQSQIQMELEASLTYLTMSAHFSNYGHYRPGIAKFFLDSAIEERSHAKKLLNYLDMRGEKIASNTIKPLIPPTLNMSTVELALEAAIRLEKSVTSSIKKIIDVCSGEPTESRTEKTVAKSLEFDANSPIGGNDYQAVDYLTGEFLEEQYAGTRKLAELLSTLKRMRNFGQFAEIMFDRTLKA